MELTSKRIYLRKINFDDIDFYLELDNRADVMQYIGRPIAKNHDEAIEHIQKMIDFNDKNPGLGHFVILENETNIKIGTLVFRHLDQTQLHELGYRIHPDYWRQGYTSESCQIIVDYAKVKFPNIAIVAVTNPENIPSQNVLKKLGFQYKGIEHYYNADLSFFEYINQ